MKLFVNIMNSSTESLKYVLVYRATKASTLGDKSTVHVQSLSSIIVNLCELYDLPDCRSLITNRYCGRTLARSIFAARQAILSAELPKPNLVLTI